MLASFTPGRVPSRPGAEPLVLIKLISGALTWLGRRLAPIDNGIARGEATIATDFLIAMIIAAALQALFRNLTDLEVGWANEAVNWLSWVDPFLQKGTLWLAFLGASLATREERHIGIDLLPRLLPHKGKLLMRGIAGVGSSVVAFFLARAFWGAVLVNAGERPMEYEVLGDSGALHVCDATAAQLIDPAPTIFCGVRSVLGVIGVPVETPEAALQLIVPAMFIVISARLLGNGMKAFVEIGDPEPPPAPRHHPEVAFNEPAPEPTDGKAG